MKRQRVSLGNSRNSEWAPRKKVRIGTSASASWGLWKDVWLLKSVTFLFSESLAVGVRKKYRARVQNPVRDTCPYGFKIYTRPLVGMSDGAIKLSSHGLVHADALNGVEYIYNLQLLELLHFSCFMELIWWRTQFKIIPRRFSRFALHLSPQCKRASV